MNQKIRSVQTEDLFKIFNKPGVTLIDARPVDAYNGWKMMGEKRGGHIPGARSMPSSWTGYIDWIEILKHKEIETGDKIIIYGYDRESESRLAGNFIKAGYEDVSIYPYFLDEWVTGERYSLEKLARYINLVPASWVNKLVTGNKPDEYNNDKFVIVHAHYRNRDAYLSGHIPGAIDMDTLALEAPETWNRRSPAEIREALETHGISSDTTVVLYGKFMSPDNRDPFPGSAAGDIGAVRCALIMMYAGVKDVRVLNSGFQSWQDGAYEVSTEDADKKQVKEFGRKIPANPQLFVDTPQAKEMLRAADSELICVRSLPEYRGETSGYNYIEARGRIPGAVFADCGSDAYHMENYRNLDHTTREYGEIEKIWRKTGITPDKHLAFYCGTGWRGSEAWFNAWLMGWPKVSVYDGGWFEWSSDPDNPFEKDAVN